MKYRTLLLSLIAFGALLAMPSFGAPIRGSLPPDRSEDCRTFLAALPKGLDYDWITVPELNNSNSSMIRVFYWGRFRGTGTPVIFHNGGPNSSSHHLFARGVVKRMITRRMPFIFMDQRGTGCSDPYPLGNTPETLQRLTHWGTRGIVRDSEAVRAHLFGEKSWKIFGQSYGSLIVHRYLAEAPGKIVAAYAHGAAPEPESERGLGWGFTQLSQKRNVDAYFAQYPEDLTLLADIRSKIPSTLCFSSSIEKVCGSVVLDLLAFDTMSPEDWPDLHKKLRTFLKSDGSLDEAVLETYVYSNGIAPDSNGETSLGFSVLPVMEINGGYTDTQMCIRIDAWLKARGETPDTWPLMDCRFWKARFNRIQVDYIDPNPPYDAFDVQKIKASLTQRPEIKFFLYSSGMDGFTDPDRYLYVINELGSLVTYLNFPNAGHEAYATEDKIWADVDSIP